MDYWPHLKANWNVAGRALRNGGAHGVYDAIMHALHGVIPLEIISHHTTDKLLDKLRSTLRGLSIRHVKGARYAGNNSTAKSSLSEKLASNAWAAHPWVGFTSRMPNNQPGSVYRILASLVEGAPLRTWRYKVPHLFHDIGDVGLKNPSGGTLFVPHGKASLDLTTIINSVGDDKILRAVKNHGENALFLFSSPHKTRADFAKYLLDTYPNTKGFRGWIPFSMEPQVGMHPFEFWGTPQLLSSLSILPSSYHVGNRIEIPIDTLERLRRVLTERLGAAKAEGIMSLWAQ